MLEPTIFDSEVKPKRNQSGDVTRLKILGVLARLATALDVVQGNVNVDVNWPSSTLNNLGSLASLAGYLGVMSFPEAGAVAYLVIPGSNNPGTLALRIYGGDDASLTNAAPLPLEDTSYGAAVLTDKCTITITNSNDPVWIIATPPAGRYFGLKATPSGAQTATVLQATHV